jgi:hypothetical protein
MRFHLQEPLTRHDDNGPYVILTDPSDSRSEVAGRSDPWQIAERCHQNLNAQYFTRINGTAYRQALLTKNEGVHGLEIFNSQDPDNMENLPNRMKIYLPDEAQLNNMLNH